LALAKRGIRFIAHGRRNMKAGNINEEKVFLCRRNLMKRVIEKLK
jgi:hypothetical protein